jgi:hypothetical protein
VSRQLRIRVEAAAFGDVEVNRLRGADQLARAIASPDSFGEDINAIGNRHRELPNFEFSIVAHGEQHDSPLERHHNRRVAGGNRALRNGYSVDRLAPNMSEAAGLGEARVVIQA